jgi:DNA polymerase I
MTLTTSSLRSCKGVPKMAALASFDHVWIIDFEYIAGNGDRPEVVCMVAIDTVTGKEIRLWRDQLQRLNKAPFGTGTKSLIISYYAPAEMGVFYALGWPPPSRIIDLFAEFRVKTNGHVDLFGIKTRNSLLDAMKYFGLSSISAQEKTEMRDLILSGGPWSAAEREAVLDYCRSDVMSLMRLWGQFQEEVSATETRLNQAFFRGQYGVADAFMEHNGVPIDINKWNLLQRHWDRILRGLISEVDREYGFFENGKLKTEKVANWLAEKKIPWPKTPTGQPSLDKDTLQDMKKSFPEIALFAEYRTTVNAMKLNGLSIGKDGRNRTMLSPFGSKTGRNLPSTSKFIFGPSTWIRGLIKPKKGYSVAYMDWKSQEIFIAAILSGDARLLNAYNTGDVYLAFAKLCGTVPEGGTKETHKTERNQCKQVVLGLQYGRQAESTARLLGISKFVTQTLIDQYWEQFSTLARWVERQSNIGMMGQAVNTMMGWQYHDRGKEPNPRTFMNFPMQATGANMLQIAACMARESGLKIVCPVHDALMLEAPTPLIESHVSKLRTIMETASAAATNSGGPVCEVDVDITRYPRRYMDEDRGRSMWNITSKLLGEAINEDAKSRLK